MSGSAVVRREQEIRRAAGPRLADIGDPIREIEAPEPVPLETPAPAPSPTPVPA